MPVGVGLDFGTTNSSIAVARDDQPPEVVLFDSRDGLTDTWRSVLYFEPTTEASSGPPAIAHYLDAVDKGRLIQSLKSFLASRLFTSTEIFGRRYTVEHLIAILLRDFWAHAERFDVLDGPVVVGRPVNFAHASSDADNEFALSRLRKALETAGIGPVVFEYEPVAAARTYEESLDHDELILIGDFGGGTSDFSLLRVGPGSRREDDDARILGNEGVAVAGDAFDGQIVRSLVSPALGRDSQHQSLDKTLPMPVWVYSELERWHYLSFLKSPRTLQMLRTIARTSDDPPKIAALLHVIENDLGFDLHQAVQETKSALSTTARADFLFTDDEVRVDAHLTRAQFEDWIGEDVRSIRNCLDRLMSTTGASASDVDRVFLTGGSSLVPAVRQVFLNQFGPEKVNGGDEFTSVARGLASRALREAG